MLIALSLPRIKLSLRHSDDLGWSGPMMVSGVEGNLLRERYSMDPKNSVMKKMEGWIEYYRLGEH
jgi:hypothetical protein